MCFFYVFLLGTLGVFLCFRIVGLSHYPITRLIIRAMRRDRALPTHICFTRSAERIDRKRIVRMSFAFFRAVSKSDRHVIIVYVVNDNMRVSTVPIPVIFYTNVYRRHFRRLGTCRACGIVPAYSFLLLFRRAFTRSAVFLFVFRHIKTARALTSIPIALTLIHAQDRIVLA